MVTTVEFIAEGEKTRLVSCTEFASEAALQTTLDMGMEHGLYETWDRLADYLAQG